MIAGNNQEILNVRSHQPSD